MVKNGDDASGTSVEGGARLAQQSPGVVDLPERQRQDGREVAAADDDHRLRPGLRTMPSSIDASRSDQSWVINRRIDS